MIRKGMVPVISFSAGLGCALLAIFFLSNTEGTTKKEADLEQKVRSVSLERHFEFAGEAVLGPVQGQATAEAAVATRGQREEAVLGGEGGIENTVAKRREVAVDHG